MFKRLLSVLLCSIMLFCVGCEKTPEETFITAGVEESGNAPEQTEAETAAIEYESCEGIYVLNDLTLEKDMEAASNQIDIRYKNDEIHIRQTIFKDGYFISKENMIDHHKIFDLDGQYLREWAKEDSAWYEENGIPYYTEIAEDRERSETSVCVMTGDGTVVYQSEPLDTYTAALYEVDSTRVLAYAPMKLFDADNLFLFNTKMELLGSYYVASPVFKTFRYADDEILIVCENATTYLLNETKKTVKEVLLYEQTDAAKAAEMLYYTDDAIYLVCEDAIYVQRGGTETQICDLIASGYTLGDIQYTDMVLVGSDTGDLFIIDVLPGDRFIVEYRDTFLQKEGYGIFAPIGVDKRPKRKTVHAAWVGGSPQIVDNSISYFNRTSTEYQIELTKYAPGDEGTRAFLDDALHGVRYDIYLIGNAFSDRANLAEKDLFADMRAFADEINILPSIMDAMTRELGIHDSLFFLPFSVQFRTLITTTDTLPEGEPFTFAKLQEIKDGLGAGEALFDTDVSRMLKNNLLFDYVDKENGTCSYDSDEFLQVLNFFEEWSTLNREKPRADRQIHAFTNPTYGRADFNTGYFYGDYFTALTDGRIKFTEINLTTPDDFAILMNLAEKIGTPINICGYPSKAGGNAYMTTNFHIALGAEGDCPDGAKAYLEMLYSDTVQIALGKTAFPVTESAVRAHISDGYLYFMEYPSVFGDTLFDSSYYIEFYRFTEEPHTFDSSVANHEIRVTKENLDLMLSKITDRRANTVGDSTIGAIIDEELSAAANGVRSIADAAKIIQSRVYIYISE